MIEEQEINSFYNSTIPNDWKIKTLVECCLIKGEYGINAAAVEYSDKLPTYIRITDIDDDGNYSIIKKVSVDNENSNSFILKKGDIVFARTGATVGKTYLYDETDGKLVFAGFLIRFRPDERILLSKHLKYYTSTKLYWDWVKTISMRSGQPGINAEEYGSLKIPLPPLPEQKAIANILSLMDTAINKNNLLIAKKELQKKWLMQNLLSEKLKVKSEKLKTVKLSEFTRKVKGKVCEASEDKSGLPCITATSFNGKYIEFTNSNDAVKCEVNDVLVLWDGENAGAVTTGHDGIIGSTVAKLVLQKGLNNYFIAYQLQYYNGRLRGIREGSGIPHMPGDFEDWYHLQLPSLDEQKKIAQVLQSADKEIQLLKSKTEKLKAQKKGLMQVLLTGKKRVIIKE